MVVMVERTVLMFVLESNLIMSLISQFSSTIFRFSGSRRFIEMLI